MSQDKTTTTPRPETLLTYPQVQERLGVSRRALFQLLNEGALDRVYIAPRTVRVPESSLARFIEARTVKAVH